MAVVKARFHEILDDIKYGICLLIYNALVFLISFLLFLFCFCSCLSLKHGKSLFRWEVQVHPHTFPLLTKKWQKKIRCHQFFLSLFCLSKSEDARRCSFSSLSLEAVKLFIVEVLASSLSICGMLLNLSPPSGFWALILRSLL